MYNLGSVQGIYTKLDIFNTHTIVTPFIVNWAGSSEQNLAEKSKNSGKNSKNKLKNQMSKEPCPLRYYKASSKYKLKQVLNLLSCIIIWLFPSPQDLSYLVRFPFLARLPFLKILHNQVNSQLIKSGKTNRKHGVIAQIIKMRPLLYFSYHLSPYRLILSEKRPNSK